MDASGTALLVIDVQEAVLDGCVEVEAVVDRINDLACRARQASAPVVFIQDEDESDLEMMRGSRGWRLAAALERTDADTVVAKTYRDAFAATDLAGRLAKHKVRHLVLSGAHSDYCVLMTAISAVVRGYDVTLAGNAHTTRSDGRLGADQIRALINARVSTLRAPQAVVTVRDAEDIGF